MVATTGCEEKSKHIAGNKVSKPLMEKKRRARINKCLDQLKSLLESYYSTSIRKRKLEKADILELTVKHLRNLQKIQSRAAAVTEYSDYQSGFSSCMANVNRYLLMADNLNGSDRWMLAQLAGKLCRSRGRGEVFSTMDSVPDRAQTPDEVQRLLPSASGSEGRKMTKSKGVKPHSAGTSSFSRKEDALGIPAVAPNQTTPEKISSSKMFHPASHGNDVANSHHNVWRPW
ncbi:hairy-related 3 [Spinachia spinachia]